MECAHQNTPYSPVLYFLSKAKLHPEKAFELLDQEQSAVKNVVKAIKKRLTGAVRVSPFGKIDPDLDVSKILTSKQLLDEIKKSLDYQEKRSLIYQILRKRPELVREISLEIPAKNLFEAVSNLSRHEILKGKEESP